jgi:hypothetical protein
MRDCRKSIFMDEEWAKDIFPVAISALHVRCSFKDPSCLSEVKYMRIGLKFINTNFISKHRRCLISLNVCLNFSEGIKVLVFIAMFLRSTPKRKTLKPAEVFLVQ